MVRRQRHRSGAITSYDKLAYTLDSLDNRLAVRNDDQVEVYLPNDGLRMTDPLNRYQQVGGRDFEYDAKGNLLSDGVNTYRYDYQNRQTGISGPGGVAEYVYDARGRRVANEIDGSTIRVVFNTSYQELEEWSSDDGNHQELCLWCRC